MANEDSQKLAELKFRLGEIADLNSCSSVLHWDQSVYMPPGGASARAHHLATLGRITQEKASDPQLGTLLEDLLDYEKSLPYESDEASLIRIARRDFARLSRVPPAFMAQLSMHYAESYQKWTNARHANDFASMIPSLHKTIDLCRRLADYYPGYEHVADPLISFSDFGMTVRSIRQLFSRLHGELVPLVRDIFARPVPESGFLQQFFAEKEQLQFARLAAQQLGYDFASGRLDKTPHPFMTRFAAGDIRITTRVKEDDLREAFFSVIHEVGHALYEQGISAEFDRTPLGTGTSSGVHESQSRFWENIVGRSKGFWHFYYPKLQHIFAKQLGHVDFMTFYRAINVVEKSLIRTDADEVTYNLHVMIRFDLECALLEGTLRVKDLPDAWRARYKADLDIDPLNDSDGVLQDMHWFAGPVGGAFQGYTIGNILSAQLFETAVATNPALVDDIQRGEFTPLRRWLGEHVHRHGSKFTAEELILRSTGRPLEIAPYMRYLKKKYGELYAL